MIINDIGLNFVNLNGEPIKKTPHSHPYSYDTFVMYKSDKYVKGEPYYTAYSDRLLQDYNKFNNCYEYAFGKSGQSFYDASPENVETFLSAYLGKDVKIRAILCSCNVSNGEPYWVFIYD